MQLGSGRSSASPTPVRSGASILAIVATIISFYLAFQGRGFLALLAAGAGIFFGLIGFLRAASPHITGGILSLIAVALSAIGVVVALIAIVL